MKAAIAGKVLVMTPVRSPKISFGMLSRSRNNAVVAGQESWIAYSLLQTEVSFGAVTISGAFRCKLGDCCAFGCQEERDGLTLAMQYEGYVCIADDFWAQPSSVYRRKDLWVLRGWAFG